MPWLEIDHLTVAAAVRAKLRDKHAIEPEPLIRFLLDGGPFEFEWDLHRHPPRARLDLRFQGDPTRVILLPDVGAPATHWTLATAYPL